MLPQSCGPRRRPAITRRWCRSRRPGCAAASAWRWRGTGSDLNAGVLRVAATIARVNGRLVITEPKSDRARRPVPLSPAVVAMLRRHRTEQKAERLRAGNQWTDSGLVFTTELGGPVDPRNLLRVIEGAAKAAGVPGVGVQTLRHSAAVDWLEAGMHIKAVRICSGTAVSASPATSTGTPPTTRRAAVDGLNGRLGL